MMFCATIQMNRYRGSNNGETMARPGHDGHGWANMGAVSQKRRRRARLHSMARNVARLFQMIDGAGNAGELDGQISREEFKSYLETKNPDKSDAEIADKVDQVELIGLCAHAGHCKSAVGYMCELCAFKVQVRCV
jgi:hypothetical protein